MANDNKPVKAFHKKTTIIIVVVLALMDTVLGVVVLISSFIFYKFGYHSLSMILCIVNVVSPDDVPLIDEAFQIAVVAVPLYKSYNNGDGFVDTIKNVLNSHKQYNEQKNKAINMSEKIKNHIPNGNSSAQNITENYSEPTEYVEMHHNE